MKRGRCQSVAEAQNKAKKNWKEQTLNAVRLAAVTSRQWAVLPTCFKADLLRHPQKVLYELIHYLVKNIIMIQAHFGWLQKMLIYNRFYCRCLNSQSLQRWDLRRSGLKPRN